MAAVPSSKKRILEDMHKLEQQGHTIINRPPPTSREELFLFPGASVEVFKELKRAYVAKPGDIFLVTYPKSGTTWMQQIVSLIKNNGVDDGVHVDDKWLWIDLFSHAEVKVNLQTTSFRFNLDIKKKLYEYSLCCIALIFIIISCLQQYSVHGAGLYKTHLPYSLVPGLSEDSPAKYIYVYRNPKDVAVSFYHHTQAVAGPIPWDKYVESFMTGGRYIHLGPIFDNHLEWWEHKGMLKNRITLYRSWFGLMAFWKIESNFAIKIVLS